MKNPYAIIFFGFLAIIMGIGKDENVLIPSEIKWLVGIVLITYGIYMIYKPNTENSETKTLTKKPTKIRQSYIYMGIGVLLLKSPKFIDPNNPYELNFMKIVLFVSGLGFAIYGIYLFFKEKKVKSESGSNE
jgi:putative Mn2+ efflux pump MntP